MPLSDADKFTIGVIVKQAIADDVTPQLQDLKNQQKRHQTWLRKALNAISQKLGIVSD